jgi:copper(I)-binding protein
MLREVVTAISLWAVLSTGAWAADLSVTGAWIRLLPGDLPAGGYFVLRNETDGPVELIGARAPDFARIELHQSVERNGLQTMVRIDRVPVPPRSTVEFRPGGYHLMLMGRRHPLAVGDTVHVTLTLADGAEIGVDFAVRGPAATGPQ